MADGGPADPRAEFAAALTELRGHLPDLSDEALARRASRLSAPSGRRVTVDARRLGEWLGGRSVPRSFEVVAAIVRAVETALPPGTGPRRATGQWQRLWQDARQYRPPTRAPARPPTRPTQPLADLVVGRPPSDAASRRTRVPLADAIATALADPSVRQVVLTGAGGVGKSQLAAAAFHRARGRGGVLVWVSASLRQSVLTTYARAWRALSSEGTSGGWPGDDDETQADLFSAWLRTTTRPWLVVLDDVDDPAELDGLWPAGGHGRTVVTTRRRDAGVIRPDARLIPVGTFTPEEARGYLRDRLPAGHRSAADLDDLAAALGHLPLALSQAAAFLVDTGMDVPAYRRLVDDRGATLSELFPPSSPADGYPATVAGAWRLALERAGTLVPAGRARAMLELLAMLAPDGIPEPVLSSAAARRWLGPEPVTAHEALLALRALHRVSLVTHEPAGNPRAVDVHALVQRAARETVPEDRRPALALAAADAVEEVWSSPDCDPDTAEVLYRNVEALRSRAGDALCTGRVHPVLRRIAPYLERLGRDAAARELCAGLVDQARARLGTDHRDVLVLRTQLASTTAGVGHVTAALRDLEEIRREAEHLLGASDPDTLYVRLQAGRLRMESGAVAAAAGELAALIPEARRVLGDADPVTVEARTLAALSRGLAGDAAGARREAELLVGELERRLGPDHRTTLFAVSDLGRWIGETGEPDAAVRAYERATHGLIAVVGPLHHRTLIARHNLAYWRAAAGDVPTAVEELTSVAADAERALGADHPTTLTQRVNLAYWRGIAGAPATAVDELARLQAGVDRVLGPDHPRALRTRQQRAELRYLAGDRDRARSELAALLAEMTGVQGVDHPRTREAVELLARWSPGIPGPGTFTPPVTCA